jgi:hypothetical protein
MNLSELAIKYGSDKAEKGHGYTVIYEQYFNTIKEDQFNILEIGLSLYKMYIKDGKINKHVPSSLKIWLDYFINANVYGFDIKDFSFISYPRTTIYRGEILNIKTIYIRIYKIV